MDSNPLLRAFANEVGFVRFQINSFDNFIENGLQAIVDEIGEIEPEVPEVGDLKIKFGKIEVGEPSITEADGTMRKIMPTEARIRDLTYTAPVYVEMTPIVNKIEQETIPVLIGSFPIMIKSKYCPLSKMSREELEEKGEDPEDTGGYFIINGTERALILIEEIAQNQMMARKQNVGNFTELVRINSEYGGYVQRHIIERKNESSIVISFANIRRLPIVILLKALGLETDKEIIEAFQTDETMLNEFYSNIYVTEASTSKEAFEQIGNHMKIEQKSYQKKRIEQIIDKYLLPHLGQQSKNRKEKAQYLISAIKKIIKLSMDIIPEDDLDHYANKRIKMAGDLLGLLFRSILIGRWGLITRIKYNYQKMAKRGKLPPIQTIVESNVVTNHLMSAMATGAWTGGRTGVSQRLDRANFIKTLSHMRMILSPLTTTQEHFEARELHPTNWGRVCPVETPEGPTIGLRKHLALLAEVTKSISKNDYEKLIKSIPFKESGTEIIVNGTPLGHADDKIADEVIKNRRLGKLSHEINICSYPDLNEIHINSDHGRVRRPLIIVENKQPKLTQEHLSQINDGKLSWIDLQKQGIIEYLDAEEENNTLVALDENNINEKTTHMEVTPMAILGISASILPFSQFNRGDRINFGAKMIGQSIGIYQSNFLMRTDTKSNILVYPQLPLIDTQSFPITNSVNHPAGQNVVMAVISYHGYNMEDAIIFNKSSIERGLFRSLFYRIYLGEERRYWGGQEDKIAIPEKDVRGYRSEEEYSKLAEDGILPPEEVINGREVLIGKISPMRFLSTSELMGGIANMRETSIAARPNEIGVVDRVFKTETINGNKLVKVIVRDLRIPEVGDKFASRHGQKSVIGRIVDESDLPFTASGYIPDLIINPHAIPFRQTIGQLVEIIAAKTSALNGKKIDSTTFNKNIDGENIREILHELGFRSDGKETVYNGITGEKYEIEIFIGSNYYQKLDHMVANKLQARSRGPVTLLTRQPTEGKAKEGGLRLGEMEKDCLLAHGAVLTLKERFDSDKVTLQICKKCGITAIYNKQKSNYVCPVCKGNVVSNIDMSYAFKLLLDELKSMLIYPKLNIAG